MLYINKISFKFVLKIKVFHKLQSYITFLINATNEHGVHSPFIFNLVTQCFYKKTDLNIQQLFLNYRNTLLKNKIVRNDRISTKKAFLLIRLINYFKPQNILELGTSLGLSTYSIHLGNTKSSITILEGCMETAKITEKQLLLFEVNHELKIGDFSTTLPDIVINQRFDFIYFDRNHQKEALISFFKQCLKTIHNDSIFIFDDIHRSAKMEQAWVFIKNHPKVTVSIDTYQWGIVFFRKEQAKEHFIIRV